MVPSPSLSGVRGQPDIAKARHVLGWTGAGADRRPAAGRLTILERDPDVDHDLPRATGPINIGNPAEFSTTSGAVSIRPDDGSPGRCHYDDARRDLRRAPSGNVSGYTPIKKQSDIRFATSFPGFRVAAVRRVQRLAGRPGQARKGARTSPSEMPPTLWSGMERP
jgi:hypothetical protein